MSRAARFAYAAAGVVCVAIGVVAIFVPGLPTTVFLLAASWLFTRSCPVLDERLRRHPRLGALLARAREGRMPARACVASIAAIWFGVAAAIAAGARGVSPILPSALVVSGFAGTTALLLLALRGRRSA
jgi:hypothetical protein